MKRALLLLITFALGLTEIQAQNKFSDTDKIAVFAKVYGFLKYYHPSVASGQHNWDQAFVDELPKMLENNNTESLSAYYYQWIESLGVVKPCESCEEEKDFFEKNFDLSWTQNSTAFNQKVKDQLKFIEKNRHQGEQHYVATQSVGQIKVTNQTEYTDFDYPSEVYRLLGFINYWNIIEYFFPYKHLTDKHWDAVLFESIPKFKNATDKTSYHNAIRELVASIDDSHAQILFDSERPNYLPVKLGNIEGQAVITGFYNEELALESNLKLGDVILKVDGKDVQEERKKMGKYFAGSNPNAKAESYYFYDILMGKQTSVDFTIKRGSEIINTTAKRYESKALGGGTKKEIVKSKIINGDIGYMDMANIKANDILDILESFKDKKSIIIDIRNYPEFIYMMISQFLNSKSTPFATTYRPYLKYPGKFLPPLNISTRSSADNYKGKIIILVNGETISRAEFTAMAFQTADNAITVGSQTTGADGDVVGFTYMGGYRTSMSGNGIEYPDGTPAQRVGIKIDVEVKRTIAGIQGGVDEILEKAIAIASEDN
ncbi:S41 family peptidase [Roseivirga sp.]|uniref:S41 family peptidase n=1 Tax=Roseivirga sp. TaxID=1964215 RepID=UPI003B8CF33C